jgi:hypothetical protein
VLFVGLKVTLRPVFVTTVWKSLLTGDFISLAHGSARLLRLKRTCQILYRTRCPLNGWDRSLFSLDRRRAAKTPAEKAIAATSWNWSTPLKEHSNWDSARSSLFTRHPMTWTFELTAGEFENEDRPRRSCIFRLIHIWKLNCEGIVSKRLGSLYRCGRSAHWVKVKNAKAPAVTREAEEDWGALTL